MRKELVKTSFLLALGEVGYIFLVALFFRTMEKYFGGQPDPPAPFGMVIILTLFVVSAAVSGALILGKPVLMYFDGRKRESILLFAHTIFWLIFFLLIFVFGLAYLK